MAIDNAVAVFLTVALAHALAVASPGPDFAMVVRRSLALGRAAGIWTAAGIGSGILFHVGYGLFGLDWLTQRWPASLTAIGLAGGLFLVWMGLGAVRAQPVSGAPNDDRTELASTAWRHFGVGLLTNVLNTKAMLFFVALFTVAVSGPISPLLMASRALWLPLSTFAWFALVATVLTRPSARARLLSVAHWIDRAMGAMLIALGASVILGQLR